MLHIYCWTKRYCCQQGHHRFRLGNSSRSGDSAFSRSPQSSRFWLFLIFSPIFKVLSFSPQSSRFYNFIISHFSLSPKSSRISHFSLSPNLQGFISADWKIKKWKHFRELGTQQQWWHVGWMSITSLSSPGDSTTFGLHYKQVKNHRYDHFCHYFFYLQIFLGELVKTIGTRRHAEVLTNIRWW